MVRLHDIKIRVGGPRPDLIVQIENRLRVKPGSITDVRIIKESVDARRKPEIFIVISADLVSDLPDEVILRLSRIAGYKADIAVTEDYQPVEGSRQFKHRPVIAGFGPCGMFAALVLARAGKHPLVLERGSAMNDRVRDVVNYWNGGELKPESNVQFGEGGAGTFSDGKLTTGTRDKAQRYVLQSFVDFGAEPEILYKQKPHIGTDVIRRVVVNLRKEIESLGGEIRFNSKLTGIETENGHISAVEINEDEILPCDCLIMGLGHSARDSFKMLDSLGFLLEQKPFSMGLRIEHPQALIDMAQYGELHEKLGIGAAEYKLSCKTYTGRGVYTFCMCPGGYVIDSSSEAGALVTNGMSNAARDGVSANSAVLCDVRSDDFHSSDPLAGMYFQEKYEKLAYQAGGGRLPRWTVEELNKAVSEKKGEGPCSCLPEFVTESICEALPYFGTKIKGFDNPDSLLYGIESRSSSPVRIKRSASGEALARDGSIVGGVYPGGEGAGYAGGIMSAAVDGIHMAELAMQEGENPPSL